MEGDGGGRRIYIQSTANEWWGDFDLFITPPFNWISTSASSSRRSVCLFDSVQGWSIEVYSQIAMMMRRLTHLFHLVTVNPRRGRILL